jgi:hypothetical protein
MALSMPWITPTIPARSKPSVKASRIALVVMASVSTDPMANLIASKSYVGRRFSIEQCCHHYGGKASRLLA